MTLNLTLDDTLLDISFIPALSQGLLSPCFSSIGAISRWPWTWPWGTPSSISFSYPPCPQNYFPQLSAQSEQFEIWPDLDLGWHTLLDIIFIPALSLGSLSPSFSSIGAIWNLTWPWPWWPNEHKLGVSRTKLHPPTKFEERGTYSLRAKWWTDRQTSKQTNTQLFI